MTDDEKLMQQALEALLWEYGWGDPKKPQLAAITALRERLAPPKQWVGLTDEEMEALFLNEDGVRFARYIESRLKDKNA